MSNLPVERVQALVQVAEEADLTQLTISSPEGKVSLHRKRANVVYCSMPPVEQTPAAQPEAVEEPAEDNVIRATMVGFFRNGKQPLTIGTRLEAGTVFGAIESLSLMNDLTAPCAGRIERVLVAPGDPVQYGSPLIVLAPAPEDEGIEG